MLAHLSQMRCVWWLNDFSVAVAIDISGGVAVVIVADIAVLIS